jgi:hypothetical protein
MHKLKSFDQFSTEAKITQTRQVEEDNSTKRSDEAETFKNLLAEFNVTSIKELTEEQKPEFFTKLRGIEVNEASTLIEEGTRGQFGKIDKKGNIESVYTHYDSYPENMLPFLRKGYKGGKNVDTVIKGGNASGLANTPAEMNFYKDGSKNLKGSIADVKKYIKDASNDGAEYVYLWDEANKEWLMADVYAGTELQPAFESLTVSVNEAIAVQYKRDAKKVATVYKNLFAKKLTDFGAMSKEGELGCIKYLFENAMEDANFHREMAVSKNIKGSITSFEVKMPGLGNYFIKIGATTTKRVLDLYYSDLANASGWSGIGIVEGTALYLESIKQEAMGQSLLNAFNMFYESVQIEESVVNEAKGFKNTTDFEKFLIEIDGMGESQIKKIMGKDYIDTPGYYKDEKGDYDDVEDFMRSNMGTPEFEKLESWWENNVAESVVTEAEVNSDEEFVEYANTVLKQAFGEEFDEAKAKKVIDGILAKADGDYGTAVGMLTSSLGA